LSHGEFNKITFEVTGWFGNPETGFKGEVTEKSVGPARFEIYEKLWRSATMRSIQGSEMGDVTGGPYKVSGGYLFVQMLGYSDGGDDCFDYYRNYVVTDYGREWLKKIYRDTLTTAARDLRPQVYDFTTGTVTSATAFVVDGHTVSFSEARATLPFLFGNERTAAFWKSIQRQALEVELIYHGLAGKKARETREYDQLIEVLALIVDAKDQLAIELRQEMTTASLEKWFKNNHSRFDRVTSVSYVLYECETSAGAEPEGAARCAAGLQKMRENEGPVRVGDGVTSQSVQNAKWDTQSREIQVACQDMEERQWSQVFSIDGKPCVLFLLEKCRVESKFAAVLSDVRAARELEIRVQFWKQIAGLADN
jgi:hypothetical protein